MYASRLRLLSSIVKRGYHGGNLKTSAVGADMVIDLRSDVLTKPTEKMKDRMMKATMDDDVYNEDGTVHELQDYCAELFGKEAALYVPSGTMGNFISIVCQCSHERGLEVLLGDKSHLILYEQGGLATIGGVHTRTMPTLRDGTFNIDALHEYIRPKDDPHQPWTAVIGVENSHNTLGGKVLPMDFLARLRSYVKHHSDIRLHMDGARMLNAAVALDLAPADLLRYVDTVSVCLSKGVGAPVGSVIAGPKDFIARALRMRKVLGGGMRKPGMLAAAGLCGLEDYAARMKADHRRAQILAKAIQQVNQGVVNVDLNGVHTNLVLVEVVKSGVTAAEICHRLTEVTEEEERETGKSVIVKATPIFKHVLRLCTYTGVEDDHVAHTIDKFHYVLRELNAGLDDRGCTEKKQGDYKEWESLLYNVSYQN